MKKKQVEVEVCSRYGSCGGKCELISYEKLDAIFRASIPVAIGSGGLSVVFLAMGLAHAILFGTFCGGILGLVWGVKVFKKYENKIKITNGQSECQKCSQSLSFSYNNLRSPLKGLCPRCATHYSVVVSAGSLV